MLGSHLLKTWSSTQPSISLSSGEAEYYGVVKAAGIALGQQSLMADLGMKANVRVWTDSSAAIGICGRSGLGKLRHVQTHTLWVQERVRTGAIQLRKVNGLVNPADLFTKHLTSRERVTQLIELFDCEYRESRASTAPLLRKEKAQAGECHTATADRPVDKTMADRLANRLTNRHHPYIASMASNQRMTHDMTTTHDVNCVGPCHDPDVHPHMYRDEDMGELFPIAVAPEAPEGIDEVSCICCKPSCRLCHPRQPVKGGNRESW